MNIPFRHRFEVGSLHAIEISQPLYLHLEDYGVANLTALGAHRAFHSKLADTPAKIGGSTGFRQRLNLDRSAIRLYFYVLPLKGIRLVPKGTLFEKVIESWRALCNWQVKQKLLVCRRQL